MYYQSEFNNEIETIKKKNSKILELRSTVTEIKN